MATRKTAVKKAPVVSNNLPHVVVLFDREEWEIKGVYGPYADFNEASNVKTRFVSIFNMVSEYWEDNVRLEIIQLQAAPL